MKLDYRLCLFWINCSSWEQLYIKRSCYSPGRNNLCGWNHKSIQLCVPFQCPGLNSILYLGTIHSELYFYLQMFISFCHLVNPFAPGWEVSCRQITTDCEDITNSHVHKVRDFFSKLACFWILKVPNSLKGVKLQVVVSRIYRRALGSPCKFNYLTLAAKCRIQWWGWKIEYQSIATFETSTIKIGKYPTPIIKKRKKFKPTLFNDTNGSALLPCIL